MYKDYESLLAMTLRDNQLTLFQLDGSECRVSLQRHLNDYINRVSWGSSEEMRQLEVQLCIDVWTSWLIHLAKSEYHLPYYSGVTISEAWWTTGTGSPPCILLSNEDFEFVVETVDVLPIVFEWHGRTVEGKPVIDELYGDIGRSVREGWWVHLDQTGT